MENFSSTHFLSNFLSIGFVPTGLFRTYLIRLRFESLDFSVFVWLSIEFDQQNKQP